MTASDPPEGPTDWFRVRHRDPFSAEAIAAFGASCAIYRAKMEAILQHWDALPSICGGSRPTVTFFEPDVSEDKRVLSLPVRIENKTLASRSLFQITASRDLCAYLPLFPAEQVEVGLTESAFEGEGWRHDWWSPHKENSIGPEEAFRRLDFTLKPDPSQPGRSFVVPGRRRRIQGWFRGMRALSAAAFGPALGSALFFLAAPGVVAGVVPGSIAHWRIQPPFFGVGIVRAIGVLLVGAAALALLDSFARFALQGRGTPAPIAPTQTLVVTGQYRYVRNPMYVAVVTAILGQALLFGDAAVLGYAVLVWLAFQVFVLTYEEPTLRRQFGESYRLYQAGVRRWLPRLRAWSPGT